eukprot:2785304-Rhodomonas_salina.2
MPQRRELPSGNRCPPDANACANSRASLHSRRHGPPRGARGQVQTEVEAVEYAALSSLPWRQPSRFDGPCSGLRASNHRAWRIYLQAIAGGWLAALPVPRQGRVLRAQGAQRIGGHEGRSRRPRKGNFVHTRIARRELSHGQARFLRSHFFGR